MDTNIVNEKVFLYGDAYMYEAQFMKKLSNTEAELKKCVAYKKACNCCTLNCSCSFSL